MKKYKFERYHTGTPEQFAKMTPAARLRHSHNLPVLITEEQALNPEIISAAHAEALKLNVQLYVRYD
jgi:hypothetical protein